ncbi:MAG TPA: sensor histidine kinase [Streptosporangiaceae bacterium]|jgi:signal transduction histidine kinase|nr:sensor histidine kinase [Streptosporangiaceae bacterium]
MNYVAVLTGGRRDLDWRRDLALPAAVLVLQLAGTLGVQRHHPVPQLGALDWLLAVVGPLALTARRFHPVVVLWITLAATLSPSGSPLANLSLVVAFFDAALRGHRRAAWAAVVAGYAGAVWLEPLAFGRPAGSLTFALLLGGWLAVLVISAEAVRLRRERLATARTARRMDERRQASDERLQMARDLHDVIGHNISLISVQAAVGLDLMDSDPDQARAALTAIRSVSREALDELRSMLATLRQAGEQPPTAPTPGLARLPELTELTRAAGIPVRTEAAGTARPLPAAVDLAAYRIIQESLTNVARHAGPATATVRLDYQAGGVSVQIRDDGRPAPGSRPAAGPGSGIAGMTERAAALGGELTAGPRPGGGFAVTAWLPVHQGDDPAESAP